MTLEVHFRMECSSPALLWRVQCASSAVPPAAVQNSPSAVVHSLQRQLLYPLVDLPILVLAVLELRKPYAWRTEGHSRSAHGLQCGNLLYTLVYPAKGCCRIERTVFRIVNEELRRAGHSLHSGCHQHVTPKQHEASKAPCASLGATTPYLQSL